MAEALKLVAQPGEVVEPFRAHHAQHIVKADGADAVILAQGDDASQYSGKRIVRLDPMESGSASADFYVTKTLQNAAALQEALK